MMPLFLQLHGATKADRHEMIYRVQDAVLSGGGFFLDFHMFSNTAICINFNML